MLFGNFIWKSLENAFNVFVIYILFKVNDASSFLTVSCRYKSMLPFKRKFSGLLPSIKMYISFILNHDRVLSFWHLKLIEPASKSRLQYFVMKPYKVTQMKLSCSQLVRDYAYLVGLKTLWFISHALNSLHSETETFISIIYHTWQLIEWMTREMALTCNRWQQTLFMVEHCSISSKYI